MRFLNRVTLSTPESVELDFTLAGIGNRTLALFIDYQILLLILLAFWLLWGLFTLGLFSVLSARNINYSSLPWWLLGVAILLNFVIYSGYFVYCEVMYQGQTPGKRFAKIRVVRDNGRPIGVSQALLRSLLRPVDDFCFIGAFFILFGKREKRIGDWVAGTLVIQDQRGDRTTALTISPAAEELATKLPILADVTQLIPDDYAVLREYLQRRAKMTAKARAEKSMELARQLRTIIGLETVPPNTTSDQFLEALYLTYQQMQNSSKDATS
ncbi:RDD family protein [Leptodesmis sichuanensis]|uniref:RDD family protein n=1 Tax=Leptodesmis sichuanensis TaxID=2906798 RepID=UPI001F1E004A|nr:RDD family protein [Leptodesmis sichuanensis]UIE40106.1 RDD family protein [Leptodesmis sichuanensis A121]